MKKSIRINWDAMHEKDYSGNCVYCGGRCTSDKSKQEWAKAKEALMYAEENGNAARVRYLQKRIQEKLNYTFE